MTSKTHAGNTLQSIFPAVLCAGLLLSLTASAAEPAKVLKLWPGSAPGETGKIGPERTLPEQPGQRKVVRLTDVSVPTISIYPAPKGKANGTAVVVCPGGGYNILAMDLEGTEIASWLNSIGVTAVLLKYRVPRRDKSKPYWAPLQDAQRAIRLTRENAAAWGIDPHRIGMIGFSAGGNLTVMAGLHPDWVTYSPLDSADKLSARPDFLIPIYPAYLGDKKDPTRLDPLIRVTELTPPVFTAVTYDDKLRGLDAALLLVKLKEMNVPAELHVFLKGGHGYGLRPSPNAVSMWPELCERWMRALGLLGH